METLFLKDIIRSNIKDADVLFENGINTIRSWLEEKVNDASVKSIFAVKEFIKDIPNKIYKDGELITASLKEEVIYQDDIFYITYSFNYASMDLNIKGIPAEIRSAVKLCQAINNGRYTSNVGSFEFVQYYGPKLLLGTKFGIGSWGFGDTDEVSNISLSEQTY